MAPTRLTDAPATAADIAEGMLQVPGLDAPGFTPFPIIPTFGMQYMTDWHAQHSPDHPVAKYIRDDDFAHADEKTVWITARGWGQLVRRGARRILDSVGLHESHTLSSNAPKTVWRKGAKDLHMPPIVAIIAHADVMSYRVLDLACQRAGLVPFLVSPNNSAAAIAHLLEAANPLAVLLGPKGNLPELNERVDQALQELQGKGLDPIRVPWICATELEQRQDEIDGSLPPLPYEPEQPQLIMHSSGTSSKYPKLVLHRQRSILSIIQLKHWSPSRLVPGSGGSSADMSDPRDSLPVATIAYLPPNHTICTMFMYSTIGTADPVAFFQPRDGPPGPQPRADRADSPIEALVDAILAHRCRFPLVNPAFCQALLHPPHARAREKLARALGVLRYGGGAVSRSVAEALAQPPHAIRLQSGYGSTEALCISCWSLSEHGPAGPASGATPQDHPEQMLGWDEIVGSRQMVMHFRPIPDSKYYDLLLAPRKGGGQAYIPSVLNDSLPEGTPAFSTGDAVEPLEPLRFPSGKADGTTIDYPRFRIVGRLDERIGLSNSEKTNPVPMLDAVRACPSVEEVVMFGAGRPCNGLVVEPVAAEAIAPGDAQRESKLAALTQRIWPFVEQGNEIVPTHSRIRKGMIIVATSDRTFERSAKGSVRTGVTLEQYAKEIDACYAAE